MSSDADALGFELIPADDEGSSPEQDVAAAEAGALGAPVPQDAPVVEPTGYSWRFDWDVGRFVRQGQSPARVDGLEALAQRCMMALNSGRYAHAVFSSEFGVEDPEQGIGAVGDEAHAAADDWRTKVRDALMVFDDVADVSVEPRYDPIEGVIVLEGLVVTTVQDVELPFDDIRIDFSED